jgi:transcription initiation factor IIE alpha subunit
MADLTVYAEALISAVARAFYDDDCIMLVDVLLAQKYLRDDDMAQRLSLPAKKLRATLQFLHEEHLVRTEEVDDLAQGGSQATKFYYLDYNRAVHSIRLRLFLLRRDLEQAELRARSNSFYLCPGYKDRRCNGRYTEEEAQQVVDSETGLFLCQECFTTYENDPNPPKIETYTLRLIDNTKDLRLAVDNLRRVSVQLSAKFIGNQQMRPGIYDLLQKVRGKGKAPITSNFPSENFALGIGSKRLAGTGRTAGIKAKKLEQQGVAESTAQAKTYLVGGGGINRQSDAADLLFLKNALGHEIQFTVERGGGARAQLLASKRRRQRRKLMDAAASRVGARLPLPLRVAQERQRTAVAAAKLAAEAAQNGKKLMAAGATLHFLQDNIGRNSVEDVGEPNELNVPSDEAEPVESNLDEPPIEPELVLADDLEEQRQLSDEVRLINFQSQYKVEMDRQVQLLYLVNIDAQSSPRHSIISSDEELAIGWEDGDAL